MDGEQRCLNIGSRSSALCCSRPSRRCFSRSRRGSEHKSVIFEYLNPWVISGYFLLAASTICVIFAFKGVDFKNGPVIESLGFPLVMILGRIFYGEKLTKNKLIGMGLIMLGVVIYYI